MDDKIEDDDVSQDEMDTLSYEDLREKKIRENRQMMMQLGLTSVGTAIGIPQKTHKKRSDLQNRELVRSSTRSSARLQGKEAVSYKDSQLPGELRRQSPLPEKKGKRSRSGRMEMTITGYEEYPPEYLDRLGTCKTVWPNVNFEKTYDPVNGTSCHQCRQKTIDEKTRCTNCESIRGQFCGTCLQNRYGENLDEVFEKLKNNEDWECPVCRDICNCSICRTRKGFPATGILAPSALNKGFPSVAHYIINTFLKKDTSDDSEKNEETESNDQIPQLEDASDDEVETTEPVASEQEEEEEEPAPPPKKAKSEKKKPTKKETKKEPKKDAKKETKQLKQTTLNFSKGSLEVETTEEVLIACRAPKGDPDYFWIAKLVPEPKKKKGSKTVLVEWFEKAPKKKGHYTFSGAQDRIVEGSIFHRGFQLEKLGDNLYKLNEDLSVYDKE